MSEEVKNKSEYLVEVRDLKQYFPIKTGFMKTTPLKAVDGVSFSIKPGETLGLVGESGCGKTTVGRSLLRLYTPTSGDVFFDGERVDEKSIGHMRKQMQMVFQDPYASLNPFFTVGEIVEEGMKIHKMYHSETERMERVYELLEMVGLNKDHANRFPHEFSGGQRQRVGIARALALNPEFIVCDEPISALDVSIQAQVVNMLMKFQEEMDLTYLFIAHDLSMVRHIADQTAVMYLGTMVEYGSTRDVYEHPVHPYTRGLLSAVPVADPDYEKAHNRIPMDGEVPSPINPKPGCRFCARCRKATAQCHEETPKLRDVGGGHMAACWNL